MRLFALAPLAVLCLPAAAGADAEECSLSWSIAAAQFAPLAEHLPVAETAEDGRCLVQGLAVQSSQYLAAEVERISWAGVGLGRLAAGLPPETLDMTFEGLRFVPVIPGDPVTAYLLREQARGRKGISGGVRYRLTGDSLLLDRAWIDYPGDNEIAVSGQLSGVDASSLAKLQMSAGTAAMSRLDLRIASHGMFEDVALLPIGNALLSQNTPVEEQVQALKLEADRFVSQLPESLYTEGSVAALQQLISTMPHPSGTLEVSVVSAEGLGVARFMPFAMAMDAAGNIPDSEDFLELMKDVSITVRWTEAP